MTEWWPNVNDRVRLTDALTGDDLGLGAVRSTVALCHGDGRTDRRAVVVAPRGMNGRRIVADMTDATTTGRPEYEVSPA